MTQSHLKNYIKSLDREILQNPLFIDYIRFKLVSKYQSTGKDIVYYCGPGKYFQFSNPWNPESKTLGGSEEAVIALSYQLASKGYNVTVYCVLPEDSKNYYTDSKGNKVKYKNYWEWCPKDVNDINIIWRDPSNCSLCENGKTFLDLHDAVNPTYLNNIHKDVIVMVKSEYHKKIIKCNNANVVPNGIYPINSGQKIKNRMVCTSSPDRCLEALLRMMPIIRREVPDAEIHWAYGFKSGITKGGLEKDNRPEVKKWTETMKKRILETEGFHDLGNLTQKDVSELYKTADLFIYPTLFPEIDCISLTKAMSAGAIPIVTPSGAMAEKMGIKYQCAKNAENIDSSLPEGQLFDVYIKEIIKTLKNDRMDTTEIQNKTNDKYNWDTISDQWVKYF